MNDLLEKLEDLNGMIARLRASEAVSEVAPGFALRMRDRGNEEVLKALEGARRLVIRDLFLANNGTFDVAKELDEAQRRFPAFTSAHEGYAVLLEEVEELWTEVKKRPETRDKEAMRKEAVQVAAMALRFIADVC